jgi:hypothetical protein
VVPAWVSSDWMLSLRVAGLGLVGLLAGGVVITLVALFATMAGPGLDFVDWGAIAIAPLLVALGWLGAGAGDPLLLTGALYTFLAFRFAARTAEAEVRQVLSDRIRSFAAAGKVGLVMSGLVLTASILLNSFADRLLRNVPVSAAPNALDLTALVFYSLFVGSVLALLALLAVGRLSLVGLLGLRTRTPRIVSLGWTGARRTILIGAVGLLLLATIGSLLDTLSNSGLGIGDAFAVLLLHIAILLSQWIDSALLLLLGATKFLHAGGFLWGGYALTSDLSFGGGRQVSTWAWLSIPILIAAYVAGGIKAAKQGEPRTQAEAAKGTLLVGPFVAAISLLAAIGWAGQPFIEDIVPIAILLPTLWGAFAVAGAWLWANQQGLPSGVVAAHPGGAQATTPPPGGPWAPPTQPASQPMPPTGQSPSATWAPPPGHAAPAPSPTPQPSPTDGPAHPPHAGSWGPPPAGAEPAPGGPPPRDDLDSLPPPSPER